MNDSKFLEALRNALPDDAVLVEPGSIKPYECDALSAYKQVPKVVVLPRSVEQVQAVMRLCKAQNVPVVPRGAGTGLSGGALPHPDGVLLSLARMNEIYSIDEKTRTARVGPGVRNLAISQAVDHMGLYYAPDPSSQIACTIGGNIAENAGGVHCLKYGLTVHNVLQVTVVTIDGELLTFGGETLDTPGYDLLALMMGSEGMLGLVVEAVVRLLPKPAVAKVIMASYDSVAKAGEAVSAVIAKGIIPAGFEMMDQATIHAAEAFVHAGYPLHAKAIMLCELDGLAADVEAELIQVTSIFQETGATELRVARDDAERALFWSGRKNAFPAIGVLSPDYYCMDGTIPRKALSQVLVSIQQLSEQYDLKVVNVFHAGDGNLHPLILFNAAHSGEFERVEKLGGDILDLCLSVGGTITGEHGVGVEKIDRMCVQFSNLELAQFRRVRAVFDADNLLNPGKAIPTLARCAEFGGMHVHQGQLPHAELERF